MSHDDPRPLGRRAFLELAGLLGLGGALPALGCASPGSTLPDDAHVVVVGAGPAGLTAGYLLAQRGVSFEILEALPTHGGRIQHATDFVDFPISLGGEWIHVQPSILDEIVNDPAVPVDVATTMYDLARDVALFEGMEIGVDDVGFTIDSKFVGSSWLDFFDQYVVPTVAPHLRYDTAVTTIDTSGERVALGTSAGTRLADRVIVTAPLRLLQLGALTFTPPLPPAKRAAIDEVEVWDGFKAFLEFDTKFYPAMVAFDVQPETNGQKLYYDASYGQASDRHVLGLFTVGTPTRPYLELDEAERLAFMLVELDVVFDGQATPAYRQHRFQNWNAAPFARGAYVVDHANWRQVRTLGESVDGRLFFAGDAYTNGDDWSSVHAAARSARRAVDELTGA